MNIPGFTADVSLYRTSGHYRSLLQSQSTSLLSTIQIAKLPGGAAPGVHGTKCGVCGITGWQWCQETLDGVVIGESYKRKCMNCGPCGPTLQSGGNFVQTCVYGGNTLAPQPCEVCNTIVTPWYVPDDIRICCTGVNFSTDCTFEFV
jgi:hypothetical protein